MKKYLVVALALGFVFASCEDDEKNEPLKVIEDSQPSSPTPAAGFYVANEDWFGHDQGTVNYFKGGGDKYEVVYRAYRAANKDQKLGVTTQFGTTWGSYIYLVSKQGNRLVVADAKTLQKKAVFTELGGDGRSFVGVNDQLGYVGHDKGLRQFDIAGMKLGNPVDGIAAEIGTLCYAEGRIFATAKNNKLYIVNVESNKVEKELDGTFHTLTRSKDGTVWVAKDDKFLKLNPKTLKEEEMDYPNGVQVRNPFGWAWYAGNLCASTRENVIYWGKEEGSSCTTLVKYDIDKKAFTDNFYVLKKHEDKQLGFYGAGFRVDPLTDNVVATVTRGWEAYNWTYLISPAGKLLKEIEVKGKPGAVNEGYYWFPAVPFFEDANKPEILTNMIALGKNEKKTIDLKEKIVDADNTSASILRSVSFSNAALVDHKLEDGVLTLTAKGTAGTTSCKLTAISNGIRVEKEIPVVVTE